MNHIILGLGFMLAVFGFSPAHAQDEPVTLVGLELGMSPDEAVAIVEAAGYVRFVDPYDRPTYNDKFNVPYGAVVAETRRAGFYNNYGAPGVKKDALALSIRVKEDTNEFVSMTFSGFETGQKLIQITYRNTSPSLTAETFKERVVARYGEPTGRKGWTGKPVWNFGNVTFHGVAAEDSLKADISTNIPNQELVLRRSLDSTSYINRIKELAEEGQTSPETTF